MEKGLYDVFLSYHWRDHPHVETIARALRERHVNVFLDRWYLHPGRPWPQELEKVMRSCKAVAVCVGPGEMGPWQQREMNMALERQAKESDFPVIPLLLPSSDPVLGFLGQNTWVDFRTTPDDPKLIAILAAAIRGESPGPDAREWIQETVATVCPYRGLLYFREEDAPFFFGRGEAIDQLVQAIGGNSFLAVVGASGSGKSSVVRAGLVPALRRSRDNIWEVLTLVPGDRPLRSLAAALAPLMEPEMTETDRLVEINKLSGALASGDLKLRDIVERVLSKQHGTDRLLMVVDQWEELYSLTADETARRCFIDELLEASAHVPVSVVLTLRGDFVGHALRYRPLSDRLQGGQINVGPMNRDELTSAITKPAEMVGLKFETGLVKRILDDAGDEPGNLPLLEFVLKQLWDHRNRGQLLHDAYDTMGRLQGAVANKADELFAKLSPLEQQAVQRIFLQLATPAEEGDYTRRRASFTEIGEPSIPVLKRLTDERLLVTSPGTGGGEETVELSHEALIRNWDKLKSWLNEDREFLLWRKRLSEFLKAWQRSTETDKEGTLLTGTFLVEAEKWLTERRNRLSDNERKYIVDSIALKNREREAEQKRQEHELKQAQNLAEEQKLRANEQEKLRRRTQLFLIGVFAFALLAAFYGYSSQQQKRIAINQGKANRQLLYVANMNLAGKAFEEAKLTIGHEILNRYLPSPGNAQQDDPRSFYWYFLWEMNHQELATLKGHGGRVLSVALSGDGKTLASGSGDGTVKLWDVATRRELATLKGHGGRVALSSDGKTLASGSEDGTVKLWDVATRRELATLKGHGDPVLSAAFSSDGKTLASGSEDRTAKLWDIATRRELATLKGHRDGVYFVALSSDGKTLASGSEDGTVKLWDVATRRELATLKGHGGRVALSSDGKTLASGSEDGTVKLWDVATRRELATLKGHGDPVLSAAFSSDGKTLASGSGDGTVKLWDVATRRELATLKGHGGRIALSSDGKTLASGSGDGTVKLWDIADRRELATLKGHEGLVWSVAFSSDGKTLASGSGDGTVKLWDIATRRELATLKGHWNPVSSVAFSSDGKTLASGSWDGTVKLWDIATRRELATLKGHGDPVLSVAFSSDGKTLASGSEDGTVKLWEAATEKQVAAQRYP